MDYVWSMNINPKILKARIELTLSPELKAELRGFARAKGLAVNEVIRRAIRAFISNGDGNDTARHHYRE